MIKNENYEGFIKFKAFTKKVIICGISNNELQITNYELQITNPPLTTHLASRSSPLVPRPSPLKKTAHPSGQAANINRNKVLIVR